MTRRCGRQLARAVAPRAIAVFLLGRQPLSFWQPPNFIPPKLEAVSEPEFRQILAVQLAVGHGTDTILPFMFQSVCDVHGGDQGKFSVSE